MLVFNTNVQGAVITHVAAITHTTLYALQPKNTTTSETYINNTTSDREERTFPVDSRKYGENKHTRESCMAAMAKVSQGTEQSKTFLPPILYRNRENLTDRGRTTLCHSTLGTSSDLETNVCV